MMCLRGCVSVSTVDSTVGERWRFCPLVCLISEPGTIQLLFLLCEGWHILLLRFLAVSLGFTVSGEIFAYVTIFKSSHWGSYVLSSWMVHPGFVFVAGSQLSRTWMSGSFESVRWNARVHRLDLSLYSNLKEIWGNGLRTHVNSKGKIHSTGKIFAQRRIEPVTLHQRGQQAQRTTNELFWPWRIQKCWEWWRIWPGSSALQMRFLCSVTLDLDHN